MQNQRLAWGWLRRAEPGLAPLPAARAAAHQDAAGVRGDCRPFCMVERCGGDTTWIQERRQPTEGAAGLEGRQAVGLWRELAPLAGLCQL